MLTESMKNMVTELCQEQMLDINCSDSGFSKALCKLNKRVLQTIVRKNNNIIDYPILRDIQQSEPYSALLSRLVEVREAYECLYKLTKAYEFRILESKMFDFLVRSEEAKKTTVNNINDLLLKGEYNKAKEVLLKTLDKGLTDHEGFILYDMKLSFDTEEVSPEHGMIARKEGTDDWVIYDKEQDDFISDTAFVEKYGIEELKKYVEILKRRDDLK